MEFIKVGFSKSIDVNSLQICKSSFVNLG